MPPLVVAALLVAYNNIVNAWRPFHGAAYVPLNLVLTGLVLLLGAGPGSLGVDGLGLAASGWPLGAALAAGAGVALAVLLGHPRTRPLLADRRYRATSAGRALYVALVRIPIGTALTEEVAFRGVLFGLLRPDGFLDAAFWSSAAFGLWHIAPTRLLILANKPTASRRVLAFGVFAGVALTFAAGIGLAWLRESGDGIAAPLIVHAGINAFAASAAAAAGRVS